MVINYTHIHTYAPPENPKKVSIFKLIFIGWLYSNNENRLDAIWADEHFSRFYKQL